jgi:beta-lactamase class C
MHMNNLKFTPFLIALLVTCPISLLGADNMQAIGTQYESFFRQLVEDRKYPGAAFAIVSRDQLLHVATAGHVSAARQQEVNPDTVFRMASVSKTFAANLVGVLVDDGTLSWEDPVTQYVPGFKIAGDTSQIRILDLMGQSTGLMPHAYDNLLEDGKSMPDIWKRMSDLSYLCQPGNCYGYQNSIFSLIEPIVQQATTENYADLVDQRLFKPLGMDTASIGYSAFVNNPNRAQPHARRGGKWQTVDVQENYYHAAPAAGVNASILDMGKWLQAQLGSHPDVLSSELIENLRVPRVKTRREMYRKEWKTMLSSAHYGLGWRVYDLGGEQLIYHGGWVSGFRADVAYSPKHDLGIVVLLNAESSGISELTTQFWKMALTP